MVRLIDADAVIVPLKEEYKKVKQAFDETNVFQAPNDVALYGALMQEVGAVIHELESQPTIDAVPVVHGRWKYDNQFHWYRACCSECGYCRVTDVEADRWNEWKFCPNCGAKMDEVKDDETD